MRSANTPLHLGDPALQIGMQVSVMLRALEIIEVSLRDESEGIAFDDAEAGLAMVERFIALTRQRLAQSR
jgi:hypothetical protein